MKDLLSAIATLRFVPEDWLDDADEVRAYRNALVHEGETQVNPVSLAEARRRLCRFFSHLPLDW